MCTKFLDTIHHVEYEIHLDLRKDTILKVCHDQNLKGNDTQSNLTLILASGLDQVDVKQRVFIK